MLTARKLRLVSTLTTHMHPALFGSFQKDGEPNIDPKIL